MLRVIIEKIRRRLSDARERVAFNRYPRLSATYARFKNSPEGGWVIGKNDAVALYDLIQKLKPKHILELGSGIGAGTAVMALSAPDAKILAMEQFEKCVKIARELMPTDLLSRVSFYHSKAVAWKNDNISKYQYMSVFENIPEGFGPFDFIFIDGPGFWVEDGQLVDLPNGDIVRILPRLAPGCTIYIDGRKRAVAIYKRYLSPYLKLIYEEPRDKYTIFERTQKPIRDLSELKIHDQQLEDLKKTSYLYN